MILKYILSYVTGLFLVLVILGGTIGLNVIVWAWIDEVFIDLDTSTKTQIAWFLAMIVVIDVLPWVVGLLVLPPWGR